MDSAIVVALISGAVTAGNVLFTYFAGKKEKQGSREKALTDGVVCLLRAEIIRSYEKYSDRGYCPLYAKQALTVAYKSYHALGGNDVATDLYDKIMDMGESPRKEQRNEQNKLEKKAYQS